MIAVVDAHPEESHNNRSEHLSSTASSSIWCRDQLRTREVEDADRGTSSRRLTVRDSTYVYRAEHGNSPEGHFKLRCEQSIIHGGAASQNDDAQEKVAGVDTLNPPQ
nr:hypothetical protein Iba_chr12cCG22850 [Ipomoea batatas]